MKQVTELAVKSVGGGEKVENVRVFKVFNVAKSGLNGVFDVNGSVGGKVGEGLKI